MVSGNYFSVLRVPTVLGRPITTQDDQVANGSPVVVISYAYWQRRFAADRSVIGRTITINRTPFTIIGVAPEGFHGEVVGRMSDLWIPLTMQPSVMPGRLWLTQPRASWLLFIGRRQPNVSLEQIQAAYPTLVRQAVTATFGTGNDQPTLDDPVPIAPGARGLSSLRDVYAESLGTLMVAVGLVLLVVCANVANLLLARGAARARELSVRMALGAGRGRLVRQLLTESLILGALGGVFGFVVAVWGSKALLRIAGGGPGSVPLDVTLDWRVMAFTGVVTCLTAILFGIIPALRATRVELAATLRSSSRGMTGGLLGAPGRIGVGKLLVVGQVALSLTLLVGTSMLVRSTRALVNVDAGLARDRLLIATVDAAPTGQDGERLSALARALLERARRIPGVTAASFSENGIFSGTESYTSFTAQGFTARTSRDSSMKYDRVGPDYFETIGARLTRGRDILATDNEHAPLVAVINTSAEAALYPNGDAIGRRLTVDSATYEIVGVVADTKDHTLRGAGDRRLYVPIFQSGGPPSEFTFELRAAGNPSQLVAVTRSTLTSVNPSLLVLYNDPLTTLMRLSITQDLLVSQVASFFGVLALALAALGLYGVMMYATTRRISEFGLRMALGAEPRAVGRMVLGEAMALVIGGTVVGVPLALAATRLLRNQLFGVNLVDVPSILLALVVLTVSAVLAGYIPATRAARVGPLEALRAE
jgi:predicted permease